HADIEIVEEHFKGKKEVSGTAQRIANVLSLNVEEHLNSIRVGGIVGRHEIIFGMPNQTIRLSHESISRAAFGQGSIFAVKFLIDQPPGMYTMETIIAEMFRQNIPVY
ncbi:MAG: Dihydrodipicolinate reductase, partial [Sporomusa sp.]|nr:Dihydrodipicolinate reductase [Sporomusa sp.]